MVVEGGRNEMQNAEQTPIVTKTNRFCRKVSFSQPSRERDTPMPQATLILGKRFQGDNHLGRSNPEPENWW